MEHSLGLIGPIGTFSLAVYPFDADSLLILRSEPYRRIQPTTLFWEQEARWLSALRQLASGISSTGCEGLLMNIENVARNLPRWTL